MSKASVVLQYPDYIKSQLSYFSTTEWEATEYEKLKRDYDSKINAICSRVIGLKKGTILYRARFIKNQGVFSVLEINEQDFFDNIRELGINTEGRTKTFGRAHVPGKPVLYTSFRAETAIHEMVQWARENYKLNEIFSASILQYSVDEDVEVDKAEENKSLSDADRAFIDGFAQENDQKNLVVSAWKLQEDLLFTYFFVKEEGFLPEEIKNDIEKAEAMNSVWNTPDRKSINKSLSLIEDFFAYEFVKNDIRKNSDYMLSALAADLAVSYISGTKVGGGRGTQPVGILYASVAEGHQGVNCVITAEAVAAGKIKFVSAECHVVRRPQYELLEEERDNNFHGILARAELVSEETGDLTWKLCTTDHRQPNTENQ